MKGGFIKSSYDEEWEYSPKGILTCHNKILGKNVKYYWDGETLKPRTSDPEIKALGYGKWNGVWLG
eukprot:CAMPEP_0174270020 /NCGR_PEP_ID=MMETSP0439-20130205/43021_1 /TAXON_ID=0 /ORGANISM="Stereomyxa ramosa, Strain Chinc5" /LENGTH=65 /DNA_ID=CAMNT_0015359095 /DNA_START=33 /DNA_END=227 /DNA_ORIENTATION=-